MTVGETDGCSHCINVQEALKRVDAVIDGARDRRGILIPALQATQTLLGYLPEEILKHLSKRLEIPFSEVAGVVSFYSFFSTVPRGDHLVRVCLGTACYVRGGKEVLQAFREALGIDVGETTADRTFSLEIGRCFGACGLAPVVMIDEGVHQRVSPTEVKELLSKYRAAAEVAR